VRAQKRYVLDLHKCANLHRTLELVIQIKNVHLCKYDDVQLMREY
jgi:hypothetical protein